jgi:predicted NBD/HSP70 family sugar kinase
MGNMSRLTLGIDIGGTFIKYALVDEEFNIVDKWKVNIPYEEYKQ